MMGLRSLRSGLVWLLVGIAISLALYADHDHSHHAAWWGGVPMRTLLERMSHRDIKTTLIYADHA